MVSATPAAAEWLRRLTAAHGPLVLFQSGGCCDGSSPMLWPRADYRLGDRDVLLGELEGVPWWIGGDQYERWKHTRLTLDVVKGRGAGFSLEAPEGVRFLIRSELCTLEELAALDASPLPRGAEWNPVADGVRESARPGAPRTAPEETAAVDGGGRP